MEGWVSFHRKIKEWEWYTDANTFRLFFHLVLEANHQDRKWKGQIIKRGQLITGRKELSKQLNMSEQQIRTSFNKLKSTNEITTKSTNKFTLVTIENYDFYQSDEGRNTNKATNNQPTNNQQITTTNNVKNVKNEKEKYYGVFEYYISVGLIKHKSFTDDMFKALKKAEKELCIDTEYMKRIIDRHKNKVIITEKTQYPLKKRSLAELFGQKKYGGVSLICSDYLDENYEQEQKKEWKPERIS